MRSFPATAPLLLLLALTLPVGCGPGGNDAGFGLVVPRTELLLPRSTQESLDVAIIREGYERPVRIEALVLPTGVTVEPVDVAGDARDAMLRFRADHNAALGDHAVQLLATGPGEPQRRTTIRLTISPGRLVLDTDFGDWGITHRG